MSKIEIILIIALMLLYLTVQFFLRIYQIKKWGKESQKRIKNNNK